MKNKTLSRLKSEILAEFNERFPLDTRHWIKLATRMIELKSFLSHALGRVAEKSAKGIGINDLIIYKPDGKKYVVVGLSTMIYDEFCAGEPEWKHTHKIQEVAISEPFKGIIFRKPSWVNINEVAKHQSLKREKWLKGEK